MRSRRVRSTGNGKLALLKNLTNERRTRNCPAFVILGLVQTRGIHFTHPVVSLFRMVHHVTLYKLKPEVTLAKLEQLMMSTRMTLLKIPEVLSVKCGKNIDPKSEWPFFITLDFESMDKLAMTQDDAIYMKFVADIIKTNTADKLVLNYEMEPGKSVKYS